MTPIALAAIAALVVGATAVVAVREPLRQAMVASIYGLFLIVAFTVLQAPDVSLSAIAASALAAPMLVVLTVAKIRARDHHAENHRTENHRAGDHKEDQ